MNGKNSSKFCALLAIFLLAFLFRLLLLAQTNFMGNADEAIAGLMARHISQGKHFPVYFYGQHYFGALQSYLIAPLLWTGVPLWVASKIVPALLSSLIAVLVWWYVESGFDNKRMAWVASLWFVVPPAVWGMLGLQTMVGFPEGALLGVTMLLAFRNLRDGVAPILMIALMGLAAGLGLWVNQQMLCYVVPITIALWVWGRKTINLSWWLTGLFFFLVGWAPFWVHALLHREQLWEFYSGVLGQSRVSWMLLIQRGAINLSRDILPTLVGLRVPFVDLGNRAVLLTGVSWVIAAGVVVFWVAHVKELIALCRLRAVGWSEGVLVGMVWGCSVGLYLALFSQTVIIRYFAAAIPMLPIICAWVFEALWNKTLRWRGLAVFWLCLVFFSTGFSYLLTSKSLDRYLIPQPYWGHSFPRHYTELVNLLDDHQIQFLYADDFWFAAPIMLETEERIIVASASNRYPQYREKVHSANRVGYLFHEQALRCGFWEQIFGAVGYEKLTASSLTVFFPTSLTPPKSQWQVSSPTWDEEYMHDLDLVSPPWWSLYPFEQGQQIVVDFGEVVDIDRIVWLHRAPQSPFSEKFSGPSAGVVRFARKIGEWSTDYPLDIDDGYTATPLEARGIQARYVCVEQLESAPQYHWYVGEILLNTNLRRRSSD